MIPICRCNSQNKSATDLVARALNDSLKTIITSTQMGCLAG